MSVSYDATGVIDSKRIIYKLSQPYKFAGSTSSYILADSSDPTSDYTDIYICTSLGNIFTAKPICKAGGLTCDGVMDSAIAYMTARRLFVRSESIDGRWADESQQCTHEPREVTLLTSIVVECSKCGILIK